MSSGNRLPENSGGGEAVTHDDLPWMSAQELLRWLQKEEKTTANAERR